MRKGRESGCRRSFAIGAVLVVCSFLLHADLFGQTSEQLWLEYTPSVPLNKGWGLGLGTSYRTDKEDPRWRTIELHVAPEKKVSKHLDILVQFKYLETVQNESVKTTEIREDLEARLRFTPDRRFETGLLLQAEQRNILNKSTNTWDHTVRSRVKVFVEAPIDQRSMSGDKVLYGLLDYEVFLLVDEDVQERYASRLRVSSGLGYKLDHRFRFELVYMFQESANSIDSGYTSSDHILRFIIKHTLNRRTKAKEPRIP